MARLVMTREIGSEFHWLGVPEGPFIPWPRPGVLFSSGREALLGLWRHLDKKNRLLVPEYFCGEVLEWWQQQGVNICQYVDGPHLGAPCWETLKASPGDVVLAVNYFGVRDGEGWREWKKRNEGTLLVEDHSHDPLSAWALGSPADYAFASLRKTYPVPDGAILWSPHGVSLPEDPAQGNWTGSALKLSAMILKQDYLADGREDIKETFRKFQVKGEEMLSADATGGAISPWSRALLGPGFPVSWRQQRLENVQTLLGLISGASDFEPLFRQWPAGGCPFGVLLIFPCQEVRDAYRERLIEARIYPAIHWGLNRLSSPEAQSLSRRILTIPVDQRYGKEDMKYIASTLLAGALS